MNHIFEELSSLIAAAGIVPNKTIRTTLAKLLHEQGPAAAQVATENAINAMQLRRRD